MQSKPHKFIAAVVKTDVEDCILWPFGKSGGYGSIRVGNKTERAHVLVCEAVHGPRPYIKAEVAHSCGSAACVNPRHLRWASHVENMEDRTSHGTTIRGEAHKKAKLERHDVAYIRKSSKTTAELAREFNLHYQTIRHARIGKTWGWL